MRAKQDAYWCLTLTQIKPLSSFNSPNRSRKESAHGPKFLVHHFTNKNGKSTITNSLKMSKKCTFPKLSLKRLIKIYKVSAIRVKGVRNRHFYGSSFWPWRKAWTSEATLAMRFFVFLAFVSAGSTWEASLGSVPALRCASQFEGTSDVGSAFAAGPLANCDFPWGHGVDGTGVWTLDSGRPLVSGLGWGHTTKGGVHRKKRLFNCSYTTS